MVSEKSLTSWDVEALALPSLGLKWVKRRGEKASSPHKQCQHAGRQELYRRGGIFSVTSQILVVDMLQSTLPTELITGILILHAERSGAT